MKHLYSILSLSFIFTIVTTQSGYAQIESAPFEKFIKKADTIVEGVVVRQSDASQRKVQGYVGQAKDPVVFNFGVTKEYYLKITHVFKGSTLDGQTIRIYSYPEIKKDVTELIPDGKYVLFLKQRKLQDGYTITDYGRGSYRVFDYNGNLKVKAWFQTSRLRELESYQNYDDFFKKLEDTLSSLP